ncbi:NAD-binding protein [Halorientalis sp.]|uniref:NAD-binding protein n=1 Tax=Halorientalis sp. TaxID=1931229 RepID=UPI00260D3CE6|nr:NAD-binding protein [Halorientalis sp.]
MIPKQNRSEAVLSADTASVVVVGGDGGRGLASRFDESATVRFVSDDGSLVRRAADEGLDAHCVDVTDASSLYPVVERFDTAIVTFDPDRTALFTAQLLRACCGVETVIACVTDATYRDAFAETDIRFVDPPSLLAGAVRERLTEPESGT